MSPNAATPNLLAKTLEHFEKYNRFVVLTTQHLSLTLVEI